MGLPGRRRKRIRKPIEFECEGRACGIYFSKCNNQLYGVVGGPNGQGQLWGDTVGDVEDVIRGFCAQNPVASMMASMKPAPDNGAKAKTYWLLEVFGGVEPVLHGPYSSAAQRDENARVLTHKNFNQEYDSIFWLDGQNINVGTYTEDGLT